MPSHLLFTLFSHLFASFTLSLPYPSFSLFSFLISFSPYLRSSVLLSSLPTSLPTSLSSHLQPPLLPLPCLYFHLLFSSSRLLYSPLILFSFLCCNSPSSLPFPKTFFRLSLYHSSPRLFPAFFLFTFSMFFLSHLLPPAMASGGISLPIAHLSPSFPSPFSQSSSHLFLLPFHLYLSTLIFSSHLFFHLIFVLTFSLPTSLYELSPPFLLIFTLSFFPSPCLWFHLPF